MEIKFNFSMVSRIYILQFVVILVITFLCMPTASLMSQNKDISKYGFEEWEMGWVVQTWDSCQGATSLEINDKIKKFGNYSLKVMLNLKGATKENPVRHPTHNAGEVYVNIMQNPPENFELEIEGPVNLEGKRISCWIYVPPKVGAGGDSHRPNGVQLFAKSVENLGKKSEKWCSKYGPWKNLSGKEGHWFKIFLVIDNKERYGGYKEECFDPRNIAIIGVKFGVGDFSKRDYEGPAYIDALNW